MDALLKGKKIIIGITGSIAAYKIPYLIRLLIKEEAEIRVIMTHAAKEFVTPLTLSTLSRNPVIIDPFDQGTGVWSNHVETGQWADLMIFAPVTANTLAKMANGIADNFLVTTYLSSRCPVYIAPAMDLDMYNHPSTQHNIDTLRSYGNTIIEPQTGDLASGLSGPGRLEDPDKILKIIFDHFSQEKLLEGKRLLVTAGPTYERIDPVRFIGNFSSGKMGFALADQAAGMGAEVTLVTGPTSLQTQHQRINRIDVESSAEMSDICLSKYQSADVIIMAAAVSDFTVKNVRKRKIKKTGENFSLDLLPTTDILKELGNNKRKDQILVGFALETDNEVINAKSKMKEKNLDFIVLNSLNDQGAGFGTDTNKVMIINRKGKLIRSEMKTKPQVANDILLAISKKLSFQ